MEKARHLLQEILHREAALPAPLNSHEPSHVCVAFPCHLLTRSSTHPPEKLECGHKRRSGKKKVSGLGSKTSCELDSLKNGDQLMLHIVSTMYC